MAFRFCVFTRRQRRHHRPLRHAVHAAQPLLAVERRRRRRAGRARHRRGRRRGPRRRAGAPHRRARSTRSGSCSSSATSSRSTRMPSGLAKRIAKPHQYFAVTKAVGKHRRGGRRATARPASSGTPRARASRWRWSSTPTWSRSTQAEQPDHRRRHRPQRTRRPALRDVQPQPAAGRDPDAGPTSATQLRDELSQPRHRRHLLHHAAEVRPHQGRAGRRARPPAAVRPAQHHRDRRRGAPQPLRRSRRVRPAPARRPALRHAHRVHRHADLLRRPQHPRRVRRRTSTSTTSPGRSTTAPPCRSTSSRG